MKRVLALLPVFFLFPLLTSSLFAQNGKVVMCDSYDDYGTPTGIHTKWDISPKGGYVYILYSQDRLIKSSLSLYVDKMNSSGNYVAFDTQYFTYDAKNEKKFAVYDYKFSEQGDYKISVMGDGRTLASTNCNVAFKEESASDVNKKKANPDAVDTYYYEESEITFGESIDDEAVVTGKATTFYLKNGKRDIMAKIQQDEDLKIVQLKVEVYGGTDYKEKISSQLYDIPSKTWNWVKVPLSFTKAGKYVVDMYSEDDVYINSAYVEIKN